MEPSGQKRIPHLILKLTEQQGYETVNKSSGTASGHLSEEFPPLPDPKPGPSRESNSEPRRKSPTNPRPRRVYTRRSKQAQNDQANIDHMTKYLETLAEEDKTETPVMPTDQQVPSLWCHICQNAITSLTRQLEGKRAENQTLLRKIEELKLDIARKDLDMVTIRDQLDQVLESLYVYKVALHYLIPHLGSNQEQQ